MNAKCQGQIVQIVNDEIEVIAACASGDRKWRLRRVVHPVLDQKQRAAVYRGKSNKLQL